MKIFILGKKSSESRRSSSPSHESARKKPSSAERRHNSESKRASRESKEEKPARESKEGKGTKFKYPLMELTDVKNYYSKGYKFRAAGDPDFSDKTLTIITIKLLKLGFIPFVMTSPRAIGKGTIPVPKKLAKAPKEKELDFSNPIIISAKDNSMTTKKGKSVAFHLSEGEDSPNKTIDKLKSIAYFDGRFPGQNDDEYYHPPEGMTNFHPHEFVLLQKFNDVNDRINNCYKMKNHKPIGRYLNNALSILNDLNKHRTYRDSIIESEERKK
jgi:hypothetical protein